MKKLKQLLLIALLLLANHTMLFAQDTPKSQGIMYSNGRIYVVVAVMVTILIGLLLYLVRLDRKISKMEKE